ncbi:hypothetical protein HAALTHF_46000n [Vreelandella aquamarina]|nr:hypothetical protein HAALTHF_46000n [Halomonas axialensis]
MFELLDQLASGLIQAGQRIHQPWRDIDASLFQALSCQSLALPELIALANEIELLQTQIGDFILQIPARHHNG